MPWPEIIDLDLTAQVGLLGSPKATRDVLLLVVLVVVVVHEGRISGGLRFFGQVVGVVQTPLSS